MEHLFCHRVTANNIFEVIACCQVIKMCIEDYSNDGRAFITEHKSCVHKFNRNSSTFEPMFEGFSCAKKECTHFYDAVVIGIAASRHLFINSISVGQTQQSTQMLWVVSISNPSKSSRIFCSSHLSLSSAVSPFHPWCYPKLCEWLDYFPN